MRMAILGGGSWGSALAIHLATRNHPVSIWEFLPSQAQEMQEKRVCPLLPEVVLPEKVFISSVMENVLTDAEIVFIAVPSSAVQSTITTALPFLKNQPIIICSKGFAGNIQLLTEILQETVSQPTYCLYGPTHAEEVGKKRLSGMVLCGGRGKEALKKEIESSTLKVELSDDLIGVQVASALKNVLAVFVGILDGIGMGDNAKAYIITKGLEEIKQVGVAWGGREETFFGLAGIGDIMVTCFSRYSRNRYIGEEIGKGRKLDDIVSHMKMVAEGIAVIKALPSLKEKFSLKLPLMTALYSIVYQEKNPWDALKTL